MKELFVLGDIDMVYCSLSAYWSLTRCWQCSLHWQCSLSLKFWEISQSLTKTEVPGVLGTSISSDVKHLLKTVVSWASALDNAPCFQQILLTHQKRKLKAKRCLQYRFSWPVVNVAQSHLQTDNADNSGTMALCAQDMALQDMKSTGAEPKQAKLFHSLCLWQEDKCHPVPTHLKQ